MNKECLIVEDEKEIARLFRDIILTISPTSKVSVAASVFEATLKVSQLQNAVVLMDYYLPDGTAMELIDRFMTKQKNGIALDIIVMSSHGLEKIKGVLKSKGVTHIFHKSEEMDDLLNYLERLLTGES